MKKQRPKRLEETLHDYVKVVFLDEDHEWFTEVVKIPKSVADAESHDVFQEWLLTPKGEELKCSKHQVVAVFVIEWRDELDDSQIPGDVLLGRDKTGHWRRFTRSLDTRDASFAIFHVHDQGMCLVSIDAEDYRLFTPKEAELEMESLRHALEHK